VDPRAGLDAVDKRKVLVPRRELNRQTSIIQPVASRNKIKRRKMKALDFVAKCGQYRNLCSLVQSSAIKSRSHSQSYASSQTDHSSPKIIPSVMTHGYPLRSICCLSTRPEREREREKRSKKIGGKKSFYITDYIQSISIKYSKTCTSGPV